MKKLSSSQLLSMAIKFERFAELSPHTSAPAYYLWKGLKTLLSRDLSEKEFLNWLEKKKLAGSIAAGKRKKRAF